jgi:hypothetical protein
MTTYASHPPTPRLPSITLFSATYCTDFTKYYSVPSCYTKAPADSTTKTVEYYTEALKYYSAPIYTTTTEAVKYYAVPTYYTEAALSCYVEQKTTLMLQFTTPRPALHLTTTPQPPSTTPKKPPITQLRTLPSLLHRGI